MPHHRHVKIYIPLLKRLAVCLIVRHRFAVKHPFEFSRDMYRHLCLITSVYNAYLCMNTWFFSPQITSNGVFSFEEVNVTQLQFLQSESSNTLTPSQSSTTPLIATLWTLTPSEQDNNRTLYARVAQDNTTLGLVRDMIAAENTALSDYQPTVAIVVTWTRELMVHTVCTVHVCLHAMQLVWSGYATSTHA